MLSEKEEKFLVWWKANRNRQKKWVYQLMVGLPVGMLVGVIIIANFSSGWYLRADMVANSQFNPAILYLAAALIAVFFAVFSKKFQWDQREQLYKELLSKKEKLTKLADAADADEKKSQEKSEN